VLVVKVTFFKGAALDDPASLFNSSLEGSTRRAIDFHEGEEGADPADAVEQRHAASGERRGNIRGASSDGHGRRHPPDLALEQPSLTIRILQQPNVIASHPGGH
jgi:hypothetical protein